MLRNISAGLCRNQSILTSAFPDSANRKNRNCDCFASYWLVRQSHEKFLEIGPLRNQVTWYGINYAGTQITQVGLSNQRKVGLDW